MFSRKNHSRRTKHHFNSTGAEVLEERRMPSALVSIDDVSVNRSSFLAYPGFTGGVTVASGDVNSDGGTSIVVGTGIGGGPHVKVFD